MEEEACLVAWVRLFRLPSFLSCKMEMAASVLGCGDDKYFIGAKVVGCMAMGAVEVPWSKGIHWPCNYEGYSGYLTGQIKIGQLTSQISARNYFKIANTSK